MLESTSHQAGCFLVAYASTALHDMVKKKNEIQRESVTGCEVPWSSDLMRLGRWYKATDPVDCVRGNIVRASTDGWSTYP